MHPITFMTATFSGSGIASFPGLLPPPRRAIITRNAHGAEEGEGLGTRLVWEAYMLVYIAQMCTLPSIVGQISTAIDIIENLLSVYTPYRHL